jgi:cob(I)alamin adenosyltransferase
MKIYTGFGDKGNTALFGGEVVPKSHLRVELYGTLDELNSIIGFLRTKVSDGDSSALLIEIQNDLFTLSSEIATPDAEKHKNFNNLIIEADVSRLENKIDNVEEKLVPLKNFILPGGCESASIAHMCRTVCRRAERIYTQLTMQTEIRPVLGIYLNRLGDLFFVFARMQNLLNNVGDVTWQGISRTEV